MISVFRNKSRKDGPDSQQLSPGILDWNRLEWVLFSVRIRKKCEFGSVERNLAFTSDKARSSSLLSWNDRNHINAKRMRWGMKGARWEISALFGFTPWMHIRVILNKLLQVCVYTWLSEVTPPLQYTCLCNVCVIVSMFSAAAQPVRGQCLSWCNRQLILLLM